MKRFIWTIYKAIYRLINNGGLELAGNMSFTGFFALAPFIIVLVAIAGFMGNQDIAQTVVELLFKIMPEVAEILGPVAKDILTRSNGNAFTLGLVTSIWVASSAIESARHGLNSAYSITERRWFWRRRLQAILIVLIAGAVGFALSIILFALPLGIGILERKFDWWESLPLARWTNNSRFVIAFIMMFSVNLILHRFLPNHRYRFLHLVPGVTLSSLAWVITAGLFSYYIQSLSNYPAVYGSLAGIIICLFFLYLSSLIFLFGGYYNAARRLGRRVK